MVNSFALFWFSLVRLLNSWVLPLNYLKDCLTLNRSFLHNLKIFWCRLWILCCNIFTGHYVFHRLYLPKILVCTYFTSVLIFFFEVYYFSDIVHKKKEKKVLLCQILFLKYALNHCPKEITDYWFFVLSKWKFILILMFICSSPFCHWN